MNRTPSLFLLCASLSVLSSCGQMLNTAAESRNDSRSDRWSFAISDQKVIQSGASDSSYNQAPAVVETANSDYLLSYKKGTNHVDDPNVILRHSWDKGATWGPEIIQWNTNSPDPTLARTPIARDVLVEFGKRNQGGTTGAAYARSTDNGFTWSAFTFFDNPIEDTSFTPTLYLNDELIMYAAAYGPYGDGTDDAIIWVSSDDGYTWAKQSTVRQPGDAGINETALAKVGATTLLAISRDDANAHTWAHFSVDMGATWGPQIDYTPQVGILQLPQLLQVENVVLLFGRNPTANQLVMFASYDGGVSFSDRTVLETYAGLSIDGGYCWPILRSEKEVFVVYYADSSGLRLPDIKSLVVRLKKKPH
ncbi:MAG: hypothetical protein JWN74_3801 [Acidobacteriaceae bacterium]|nr:hypothetical protein [Acidobacteriaceae bacterium]